MPYLFLKVGPLKKERLAYPLYRLAYIFTGDSYITSGVTSTLNIFTALLFHIHINATITALVLFDLAS